MSAPETLREEARREFRKVFAEPQVLKVQGGEIDRWTLKRETGGDMFVTLDAPEMPDLVHIMISDPMASRINPITSVIMRTMDEVRKTMRAIEAQWKDPPTEVARE